MKKLIILDVPDGQVITSIEIKSFNIETGMTGHPNWKLITPPTEEEIGIHAEFFTPIEVEDSFQLGANWYRNEILKQMEI